MRLGNKINRKRRPDFNKNSFKLLSNARNFQATAQEIENFFQRKDILFAFRGFYGKKLKAFWLFFGTEDSHKPVSLLRIFFGGVPEESGADCLLDPGDGLATGHHVQLVPVHDAQQLLPDVLDLLQLGHLDEVLETPGTAKLVVFPRVVHCQQGQVIA